MQAVGIKVSGNKAAILARVNKRECEQLRAAGVPVNVVPLGERLNKSGYSSGRIIERSMGAMMSVTRLKKEFRLTEKDLVGLEQIRKPNPYGEDCAPMRLYYLSDIRAKALAKHGTDKPAVEAPEAAVEVAVEPPKVRVRRAKAAVEAAQDFSEDDTEGDSSEEDASP